MKRLAILLMLLVPSLSSAANFNPSWTLDGTYGRRWMLGALVGSEGHSQVRAGLFASRSGVLVLMDAIRHNYVGGPLFGGLGAVVSTEPSVGKRRAKMPGDSERPRSVWVDVISDRPEETHIGAYAVLGFHSTARDAPNTSFEIRLMGMDDGGRIAASFGVIF